jgi:hypothetical protein
MKDEARVSSLSQDQHCDFDLHNKIQELHCKKKKELECYKNKLDMESLEDNMTANKNIHIGFNKKGAPEGTKIPRMWVR